MPLSGSEKQKATMRATLCFLYLKAGRVDKANQLASELPRVRESREVIQPLIQQGLDEKQVEENIKSILHGDNEETLDFAALKCYNATKWIKKEVDHDADEFP